MESFSISHLYTFPINSSRPSTFKFITLVRKIVLSCTREQKTNAFQQKALAGSSLLTTNDSVINKQFFPFSFYQEKPFKY